MKDCHCHHHIHFIFFNKATSYSVGRWCVKDWAERREAKKPLGCQVYAAVSQSIEVASGDCSSNDKRPFSCNGRQTVNFHSPFPRTRITSHRKRQHDGLYCRAVPFPFSWMSSTHTRRQKDDNWPLRASHIFTAYKIFRVRAVNGDLFESKWSDTFCAMTRGAKKKTRRLASTAFVHLLSGANWQ